MLNEWFDSRKANKYFKNGIKLMLDGRQEQAIEEFNKAISIDQTFLDAYLQRGIAFVVFGEKERGIADLNYVLSTKPDVAAAHYWMSVVHLKLKEIDLAFEHINQAIDLDPNEPANYLIRGFVYSHQQEFDLSLKDMTTGIELGFEVDGYNNRAIVFEEKGDYASAIADWTKVIHLAPKQAKAFCRRGILNAKIGQIDQAIIDLKFGLQNKNQLEGSLRQESEILLEKLKPDK